MSMHIDGDMPSDHFPSASTPIIALEARLADAERRIAQLEREIAARMPWYVPDPIVDPIVYPVAESNTCRVCGMRFEGAMGYVCPHMNCPGRITFISSDCGSVSAISLS